MVILALMFASMVTLTPSAEAKQHKNAKVLKKPEVYVCQWTMQCGPGEFCDVPEGEEKGVCVDDRKKPKK